MSNKVIITSDITCDLNKDLEQRYGVTTIPLHIVIGGKSYEDWVNITPEELYEIFYQIHHCGHRPGIGATVDLSEETVVGGDMRITEWQASELLEMLDQI